MPKNSFKDQGFTDFDICVYHLIFLSNSIENTFSAFVSVIDRIDASSETAFCT